MSAGRLLLITPVRNEADNIVRTARAVGTQTRPPDLWLIVDDGSDDATPALLAALEHEIPFLRVLRVPEGQAISGPDRLAVASEARAFNWAFGQIEDEDYTHIGKLDGDIELPADYFERLLERFAADPQLGIAGGTLLEHTRGKWRVSVVPEYHVRGALKLFSRACFDAVGGIQERLGWDTIDETYARMRGFTTRSFGDLVARHLKPEATADGTLRGRARHGQCAYILNYGLGWVALRSLKVAASRPVGISGAAFLFGYLRSAARRDPRVEDPEFRRFTRRELRGRLKPGRVLAVRPRGSSSVFHAFVRRTS